MITALTVEARTLVRRPVAHGEQLTIGNGARLAVSGSGAHPAGISAEQLLDQGVRLLISWGTAGGLASRLKPGALLLPSQVLGSQGEVHQVAPLLHRQIHQRLAPCSPVHHGSLVEAHRVIDEPADKARLHASSGAGAVDMESAAIARVAQQAGIPFIAIRTVLDHSDTAIPEAARVAVDEAGRLHWRALSQSLLRQPRQLSALLRLAADMHRAQQTLQRAGRLLGLRHEPN